MAHKYALGAKVLVYSVPYGLKNVWGGVCRLPEGAETIIVQIDGLRYELSICCVVRAKPMLLDKEYLAARKWVARKFGENKPVSMRMLTHTEALNVLGMETEPTKLKGKCINCGKTYLNREQKLCAQCGIDKAGWEHVTAMMGTQTFKAQVFEDAKPVEFWKNLYKKYVKFI